MSNINIIDINSSDFSDVGEIIPFEKIKYISKGVYNFDIEISWADEKGIYRFSIIAVIDEIKKDIFISKIPQYHLLPLSGEELYEYISRIVKDCEKEDWNRTMENLRKKLFWEFEDYQIT